MEKQEVLEDIKGQIRDCIDHYNDGRMNIAMTSLMIYATCRKHFKNKPKKKKKCECK